MKQSLICLLLLVFSLAGQAQHLRFMGISIEGNITQFTDSMKPRYKLQKRVPDQRMNIYKGYVNGYGVYLQASYSRKSRTVYKVEVHPKNIGEDSWLDSLQTHYGEFQVLDDTKIFWEQPGGKIVWYQPEGYDPTLFFLDNAGLTKFNDEK